MRLISGPASHSLSPIADLSRSRRVTGGPRELAPVANFRAQKDTLAGFIFTLHSHGDTRHSIEHHHSNNNKTLRVRSLDTFNPRSVLYSGVFAAAA